MVRLIFVSTKQNSNKFWFADVVGSTLKRRWGRVGSKGQTMEETFSSPFAAETKMEQLADAKRRKGYTDAQLLVDSGTVNVGGLDLRSLVKSQVSTSGDTITEKLLDYLVDANIHTITASTKVKYQNGQLTTALGPITPQAIQEARSLLGRIGGYVRRHRQNNRLFVELVEQYIKIVPTKVGRRLNPVDIFPDMQAVQEQNNVLDAMESLTIVDQDTEEVFNLTLTPADKATTNRITKKFMGSRCRGHHNTYQMRVKRVWIVENENDTFDDSKGNVQELWHGTKASNLLAIFKTGLKIVASGARHTTGRMFGNGLYFTDQSTKALNYATNFWNQGGNTSRSFMLICDVAMGRSYTPRSYNESFPKRGYDSTFAKGGQSGVINNEMIVYSETQAKIRYLVEFE